LALLIAGYVGFYSIAHLVGFESGDLTGRIVPIIPLIAASAAFVFPEIHVKRRKQVAIGLMLLMMLIIPYFAQISIGPQKAYVISPEKRIGERLRAFYVSGRILCDVPAVIYYSGLDPSIFVTSSEIPWNGNESSEVMSQWLLANQIGYLVWQNSTDSAISVIFPDLGGPRNYQPNSYWIGNVNFQLLYEDSLAAGNWEHSPDYGEPVPPSVFLYQISL
jgi:hypothetical protein